jgi:hypothetical protein
MPRPPGTAMTVPGFVGELLEDAAFEVAVPAVQDRQIGLVLTHRWASISPRSYRPWQLGQRAMGLSKVSFEPSAARGSMWAISTGCSLQVGIAHRWPASTLTARSNGGEAWTEWSRSCVYDEGGLDAALLAVFFRRRRPLYDLGGPPVREVDRLAHCHARRVVGDGADFAACGVDEPGSGNRSARRDCTVTEGVTNGAGRLAERHRAPCRLLTHPARSVNLVRAHG